MVKGKSKVTFQPITGYKGPEREREREREQNYSSTNALISALDVVG
jgi:hypothetical protein